MSIKVIEKQFCDQLDIVSQEPDGKINVYVSGVNDGAPSRAEFYVPRMAKHILQLESEISTLKQKLIEAEGAKPL